MISSTLKVQTLFLSQGVKGVSGRDGKDGVNGRDGRDGKSCTIDRVDSVSVFIPQAYICSNNLILRVKFIVTLLAKQVIYRKQYKEDSSETFLQEEMDFQDRREKKECLEFKVCLVYQVLKESED